MHLPSLLEEKPLDIYAEINYELEGVKEGKVLPENVHYMAWNSLPSHEADLIEALFHEFADQIEVEEYWINQENKNLFNDVGCHRYFGKSQDEFEEYRMQAMKEIFEEENTIRRVEKFYEYADVIHEAAHAIAYQNLVRRAADSFNAAEICCNLLESGKLSLTEIVNCVPGVDMYDLYKLAGKANITVTPTEAEVESIEKEKERHSGQVNLAELLREKKKNPKILSSNQSDHPAVNDGNNE